jgi:hypothetical protein
MKTHIAFLIDRFRVGSGRLIIRAQDESGRILDVAVPPELEEEAAKIWGGGLVLYRYRGGKAFYCRRPPYGQ